ncbi:hypothetical protein GALL_57520 [mine drainage metagenome]|uniref:Uncharacterized protein n=1 Tax=mine drainage metagenome TaxID=410659 RepID=A0A1J5T8R9_9ZZZZ
MPKVPLNRQLFHDNIDNAQKNIIHLNNPNDTVFTATGDLDIDLQLTQFLHVRVDNMQAFIENDSLLDDGQKFRWLRGINDLLNDFIDDYRFKRIKGILLGDLITAFEEAMHKEMQHQPITPVIENNELEIGKILLANFALKNNSGISDSKDLLLLKTCERFPENIMPILSQHPSVPFADSLLTVMAYRNPEEFYNYASAYDALSRKIKTVKDPLVQTIVAMATSPNGRFLFPFLDDIYHHKLNLDSLLSLADNEFAYYKLLVKTQISYAMRAQQGDTPFVMHVLTEKLRSKAIEIFINEINALHDAKDDAVRFRKTDSLSAAELYYLCVLGEEEIYTSSYLGVYKRIWQRMTVERSDTLLNMVHYDYYKKFIRMAAAYNVLDDFLKRMDQEGSQRLMKNFVNDLEKNNSLEDAVDVADSYASITDDAVKKLLLNQVQQNLEQNLKSGNVRGQKIYFLLNKIFSSADDGQTATLSALGIPAMYNMPVAALKNSAGRIIIEQFFYGDKDGVNIFNSFLRSYTNANWKIVRKPEWVEVHSVRGTPISIYSNRPLDTEKELDAEAQHDLANYLDSLGVSPTVVLHRGHSYYVKSTIQQLPTTAKVVLLGSCGGYHSLDQVLNICPAAQIIASKQVGTGVVNITLIEAITETLRQGKDLIWPAMWQNLQTRFNGQTKEKFEDYVPPHKNLGAIFIMAYNKSMGK